MGFFLKVREQTVFNQVGLDEQLHPVNALIAFFLDNS